MTTIIAISINAGSGGRIEYTQIAFATSDGGQFVAAGIDLYVKSRKR